MIYTDNARMIGDDIEDLHEFAQKIGLRRGWFNDYKHKPHYDILETPLQRAIKSGKVTVVSPEYIDSFFKKKTKL